MAQHVYCAQSVSLHNLRNILRDVATFMIGVRVRIRVRSKTYKLGMYDFEIAQPSFQIVQIGKSLLA